MSHPSVTPEAGRPDPPETTVAGGDAAFAGGESAAAAVPADRPRFDHERRTEVARNELERRGVAGMVLVPGANLRYFTGVSVEGSERLLALLLPAAGEAVLVAPAFERERVEHESRVKVDVATWSDAEDAFALARRAIGGGTWLLDPVAPFWIAERLRGLDVALGSAGPVCAALRRRKDADELSALARAQRLTRVTLADVRVSLEPGLAEREVADRIVDSFRKAGADGWALVQFGKGSAIPHGEPGARRLAAESAVLVDLGAIFEGYHADLTRSWWHGECPAAGYIEARAAVEEAHEGAGALARPGARAGDLDRAAREHLAERGLDSWFTHRLGHGVGLEIHEEPYLVAGSDVTLETGDVLTIEPGVYLSGRFGIRHEEAWVVGDSGARPL